MQPDDGDGAAAEAASNSGRMTGILRSRLTRRSLLVSAAMTGAVLGLDPLAMAGPGSGFVAGGTDPLRRDFLTPPDGAKVWCYWWWLDGAASEMGITADLEAMKQQGISGALIFNAGEGGPSSPKGPPFMSDAWRAYFRFAVREAGRLGIELAVNLCDGWNCGGPWVTQEDAIKDLTWQETIIEGPGPIDQVLVRPSGQAPRVPDFPPEKSIEWYRDIAVLACRESGQGIWRAEDIQDLTAITHEGRLRWQAPPGRWSVLRLGYVVRVHADPGPIPYATVQIVKDSSTSALAWEIDPMSAGAMDRHFAHTGRKLIEDAGALAGKTLKYLHIDSWEIGVPSWTAKLIDEFKARRGYDPTRYLPALAGKTLDTPELTARFTWDYRRTLADLVADNYYGRLATLCHQHGLGSESESGGPFYAQYIDGMQCEGVNDLPMAEFWASRTALDMVDDKPFSAYEGVSAPLFRSAEKWFPAQNYGSIRQAVNTAHVYGKPVSQAEAYTTFNDDWTEDPYFLKSFGDRALCLGLTRQVLSFLNLQSTEDKPGYEWEHVGTHFDRNVTWFPMSYAWLSYLARCQHMLRQGRFAADILYFAGEAVPNFTLLDRKPIAGFDFDVINAQALLARATAADGRVMLPDGMSYRYLVLPEGTAQEITPAVLEKMRRLVAGGVTLVGARPQHSLGLVGFPQSECEVHSLADELWGTGSRQSGMRRVGAGRVIWGRSLEEVIRADGLQPDVELRGVRAGSELDWIHRRDGGREIYFLANLTGQPAQIEAVFRVTGRQPQWWDPVTGEVRDLMESRAEGKRTAVPLELAPKQSGFVVFGPRVRRASRPGARNFPALQELATLSGPWEVAFDEEWGGPASVVFQHLEDWTRRPEEGIRYYSGTATYRKAFDSPRGGRRALYLELGEVKNLARVRLNGKDLGVVWTAPWRVALGDELRAKGNQLEIEVVNLWPNRLIGDGLLPKSERRTKTNVRTYDTPLPSDMEWASAEEKARMKTGASPKLLSSGLLGPVRLLSEA